MRFLAYPEKSEDLVMLGPCSSRDPRLSSPDPTPASYPVTSAVPPYSPQFSSLSTSPPCRPWNPLHPPSWPPPGISKEPGCRGWHLMKFFLTLPNSVVLGSDLTVTPLFPGRNKINAEPRRVSVQKCLWQLDTAVTPERAVTGQAPLNRGQPSRPLSNSCCMVHMA